jgi:hypothetical protein
MCRAGARWVQEEILAKHPSPTLRVYAVWLPMVWSDTRRAWESRVLADPRVIHLWDEQRITGQWFAEHIGGIAASAGTSITCMVRKRGGARSHHL